MNIEKLATFLFALALIHTFCVSFIAKFSHRFPAGSGREAFFHLLSEVEVVFGFWAFWFLFIWAINSGLKPVIEYQESLNMTEPLFIFCIMILASTRPIITMARKAIMFLSDLLAKVIPAPKVLIQFFILLTVGPLLGSFITEPAAITIVALLLYRMIDPEKISTRLLYLIVALLFVNISVGGALTNFAAPPILVVARIWDWSLKDVFVQLGEAAMLSVFVNATGFVLFMKNELATSLKPVEEDQYPMPLWVVLSHLAFLVLVVLTAHYPNVFFGIFLVFIGLTTVTKKYQDGLKFREALLVGFFLGGLITFGSFQKWWLQPLIESLSEKALYLGAIGLTAVTDNAALTYLGAQVPTITDSSKWALVSGALVGGGLTILANAPNPAGYSILSSRFKEGSLNAGRLFISALPFTIVAALSFLFLGNF